MMYNELLQILGGSEAGAQGDSRRKMYDSMELVVIWKK